MQVLAQGCISSNPDDIDRDLIVNDCELDGLDVNNDSVIDLNLKAMGFSPTGYSDTSFRAT
jgi:hypothetical protein